MKKMRERFSPLWESRKLKLSLRKMKLTLILSLLVFLTFGNGFSQVKVSLKLEKASIQQVMETIEDQTGYVFLYKDEIFEPGKKYSVDFSDEPFEAVLRSVCRTAGVDYEIRSNRQIILTEKKEIKGEGELITITFQEKTVTGVVTDEEGVSLPGVSVVVKGTTTGTVTNADGEFSLSIPSDAEVLQFSFVGMLTKDVAIEGKTTFTVVMEADVIGIEEVVAVGYGVKEKANLTGAVESVNVEEIQSRPLTNTSLALQGKVAGAFISQTSGQPGNDDASILIRGVGTFGNSQPLVIIDGIVGDLRDVNPKDLASVSILKDAASAAIYGNRAANGVILITTKRGKSGEMKMEYTGYYGVQNVTQMPELLKGVEYLELRAQAHANSNNGVYPSWYNDEYMDNFRNNVDPMLYPTDYDWVSDVFSPANIVDNYINISGGDKSFRYSASVGYLNQDGIVDGNSTKKFSIRTNFSSHFFNDKLRLELNLSGYDQFTEDMVNGMNNAMYFVYVAPSTSRRYIPTVGYTGTGYNWAANDAGGYRNTHTTPMNVRMAANLEILKGLNITTSYNFRKSDYELEIWKPTVIYYSLMENGQLQESTPTNSSLNNTRSNTLTREFNAQINYSLNFLDDFDFSILGGFEARDVASNQLALSRDNFSMNLPNVSVGDPSTQKNSGSAYDGAWLSYFSRINASYKNRYLIEGSVRYDGSSRFQDKWGTFPSASIGWRVSEEPFMKYNFPISNLKLRASWGMLGNESIGQYYAASDELSLNLSTNFNNSLYPAGAVTRLANRNTSWETSEQINFGLDIGLVKNKITASVDYFIKNNSDILMQLPLSSTLGISNLPYQNAAAMRNTGIEMLSAYTGRIGDFGIKANLTASHTVNEITDLSGQDPIILGDLMWTVGEAYNSFYAYKTEGIYQSQEEIENHLRFTDEDGNPINPYAGLVAQPGDIRFKDINSDGIINADDKTLIGKPYPDWLFSSNIDLEWKNWDMGVFFQGVYGVNSLNQGMVTAPFHGGGAGTGAWYRNGWTEEKPSETIQKVHSDPGRFDIVSDYYLEDASYIRLKNFTLGYSIPEKLLSKIKISDIRVYGNIQNAYTWTKMRYGFDPEKPSTTTNTLQYPQTRIFSLGVNVKF